MVAPQASKAGSLALELKNISKCFQLPGRETLVALDHISFDVKHGEFLVIVGHNGSGKSTLLNIVNGSLTPDSGTIRYFRTEVAPVIARVRQSPGDGTFPDLTVCENFQLSLLNGSPSPLRFEPTPKVLNEVSRRLSVHGMENKLHQRVSELSQGQRQLLAIELATSRNPEILLLDEHTASLDRKNALSCMEATARIVNDTHTTVIMVTHNLADAIAYGDTLLILKDGKIVDLLAGKEKAAISFQDLVRCCGLDGS